MKKMRTKALVMMLMMTATVFGQSKVYMTKEITPESLVKIYTGCTQLLQRQGYELISIDK